MHHTSDLSDEVTAVILLCGANELDVYVYVCVCIIMGVTGRVSFARVLQVV